jgi:hypothetical protein
MGIPVLDEESLRQKYGGTWKTVHSVRNELFRVEQVRRMQSAWGG